MRRRIATVINFCTNDFRFFAPCIEAVRSFSDAILVPVCDHFFDGSPENYALLESLYAQYSDLAFIEFAYREEELYGTYVSIPQDSPLWVHHWHNTSRLVAYSHLPEDIEYVLFLDVDEILDGKAFEEWLASAAYRDFEAMRFASYWYFREARFRAADVPDTGLMIRRDCLSQETILDPDERMGTFYACKGKKKRWVKSLEGLPMLHHFSWVRTKEEMLKKVRCWGHHWERDWNTLVEKEYAENFKGKDFVRYYKYAEISPFFDPLLKKTPKLKPISLEEHRRELDHYPHVLRATPQTIFRNNLMQEFNL